MISLGPFLFICITPGHYSFQPGKRNGSLLKRLCRVLLHNHWRTEVHALRDEMVLSSHFSNGFHPSQGNNLAGAFIDRTKLLIVQEDVSKVNAIKIMTSLGFFFTVISLIVCFYSLFIPCFFFSFLSFFVIPPS